MTAVDSIAHAAADSNQLIKSKMLTLVVGFFLIEDSSISKIINNKCIVMVLYYVTKKGSQMNGTIPSSRTNINIFDTDCTVNYSIDETY